MSVWGPLAWRYETQQPRKMLSLDGGGIRGLLTLEILLQLETQLKAALKKDGGFTLSDYFDYIGGTSTGAIIAAGLSLGMTISELLEFYVKRGEAMFDKAFLIKRVKYFYNDGPLLKELQKIFGTGDIDLRSGRFKTLFLAVTMNRSTDSPWPISNIPGAKYNNPARDDCNLRIPLYQLVRASTAAPVYFRPETLQWDPKNPEKTFVFVDGGVTPYNNPAFLMYRMATQAAYGLNWKTGEKELLIASVGTGSAASPGVYDHILDSLKELPGNLMYATQVDQDIICRTVGRCVFGAPIDREMGDLIPIDNEGRVHKLENDANRHFTYVRYNADLSQQGKATVIASQLPVSSWYDIIGEDTIADAILDRLVHTAYRIELKGESLRKKGKIVRPSGSLSQNQIRGSICPEWGQHPRNIHCTGYVPATLLHGHSFWLDLRPKLVNLFQLKTYKLSHH